MKSVEDSSDQLKRRFGAASEPIAEQDIRLIEEQLGVAFPVAYQRFFIRCNGVYIDQAHHPLMEIYPLVCAASDMGRHTTVEALNSHHKNKEGCCLLIIGGEHSNEFGFGFRISDLESGIDDAPVHLQKDYGELQEWSPSFTVFLDLLADWSEDEAFPLYGESSTTLNLAKDKNVQMIRQGGCLWSISQIFLRKK